MATNVVLWPYAQRLEGRLDLFEKAFPRESNNWYHNFDEFRNFEDGAVVIINGGAHVQDLHGMQRLNDLLKPFRWVALFSICDESSGQHLEWIDHPRCSIWVQDPKPNKHDFCHRIPSWPLSGYEKFQPNFDKTIDWFFSGSVRDEAWDAATRRLPGQGHLLEGHTGYEIYMQHLASAKFCPCRPCFSGPETCRIYDALEMGCIPIVGIYPAVNPECGIPWWPSFGYDWPNYWEYLYGEKPPFPVITAPEQLVQAAQNLLDIWTPEYAKIVWDWWQQYKLKLIEKMRLEVARLASLS